MQDGRVNDSILDLTAQLDQIGYVSPSRAKAPTCFPRLKSDLHSSCHRHAKVSWISTWSVFHTSYSCTPVKFKTPVLIIATASSQGSLFAGSTFKCTRETCISYKSINCFLPHFGDIDATNPPQQTGKASF